MFRGYGKNKKNNSDGSELKNKSIKRIKLIQKELPSYIKEVAYCQRSKKTSRVNLVHILYENTNIPSESSLECNFNFLDVIEEDLAEELGKSIQQHGVVKVYSETSTTFIKERIDANSEVEITHETLYLNTNHKTIDLSNYEGYLRNVKSDISEREIDPKNNSGLTFLCINGFNVYITPYTPAGGSSYVKLPPYLIAKRSCINVKNFDENCFQYSVLTGLTYQYIENVGNLYFNFKNGLKRSVEKNFKQNKNIFTSEIVKGVKFSIDMGDLKSPITLADIYKFEKLNNIRINVYTFTSKRIMTKLNKLKDIYEVGLTYFSKLDYIENESVTINLLFFSNHEISLDQNLGDINYHYCYVSNLSRLIGSQKSSHSKQQILCDRCLCFSFNQSAFINHRKECLNVNNSRIILPQPPNNILKFKNFKHSIKTKFVIYADIETYLKPYTENLSNTKTKKLANHIPYSIGYYIKSEESISDFVCNEIKIINSSDCIKFFLKELYSIGKTVVEHLKFNRYPIYMSETDEQSFRDAKICYICNKKFTNISQKVRDHNHFSDQNNYRGAAHYTCNLMYSESFIIPVIFHNLSGYDSHIIIQNLCKELFPENAFVKIDIIPISAEKFISFTIVFRYDIQEYNFSLGFRFIDSLKFLNSSLDKLASYLPLNDFKVLKQFCDNELLYNHMTSNQKFELMRSKGVLCYDYIDSLEKLELTELPSIENFYDSLNERPCLKESYNHAIKVWNSFKISNLKEYTNLYLTTDVLLLVDVFESFRSQCLKDYDLDPAHYYTLPGFSFDAMLKFTQMEFELISDIDIHLFFEKSIRGGVCQASSRYSKANNRFMGTDYDPKKDETFIMYFDFVSLYGFCMRNPLPTGGFRWIDANNEQILEEILKLPADSPYGYLLEVDLEYPIHLHDKFKDLPFCPIKECPPNAKNEKLLLTLNNKEEYVLHYRTLQQCVLHGMILRKVHRILYFKQSPCLRPYIDFNTEKRKLAKNEFEKGLYKLMINSIYGKTIENTRKRCEMKLTYSWENIGNKRGSIHWVRNPKFNWFSIVNKDLALIALQKPVIHLNKPIYLGACILDIAKFQLFDFHYTNISTNFGSKVKLLYTDTDSLIYEFKNVNPYEFIKNNIDLFDTSNFESNNIYNIPLKNKKVAGKMKDENGGLILAEFVGLQAKVYTTIMHNSEKSVNKVKGITSHIANQLSVNDYFNILTNNISTLSRDQNLIRSFKHNIFTIVQSKQVLSSVDNKRIQLENGFDTIPYGYKINKE